MFSIIGGNKSQFDTSFKQEGFTLIELMIVVGIIGILASIGSTNYIRYQAKARQAEAKFALAAVYSAEKSFYTEFQAYLSCPTCIGYSPEGSRQFYQVGFWANGTSSVTGYGGLYNPTTTGPSNMPQGWSIGGGGAGCTVGTAQANTGAAGADPQTFLVAAIGQIRNGPISCDEWTMNESKLLRNTQRGY